MLCKLIYICRNKIIKNEEYIRDAAGYMIKRSIAKENENLKTPIQDNKAYSKNPKDK